MNHLLLGDKNWLDYSFSLFEDLKDNGFIAFTIEIFHIIFHAEKLCNMHDDVSINSSLPLDYLHTGEKNRTEVACIPIMRGRSTFPTGHISLLDFSLTCPGRTVTLNS